MREAKNALAVEGALVGLRRFPPDAEGTVRWVNHMSIHPRPNAYELRPLSSAPGGRCRDREPHRAEQRRERTTPSDRCPARRPRTTITAVTRTNEPFSTITAVGGSGDGAPPTRIAVSPGVPWPKCGSGPVPARKARLRGHSGAVLPRNESHPPFC